MVDIDRERLREIFDSMKARCRNEKNKSYKYYGGRGIKVCDEWLSGFKHFYKWSMENGYKPGLSIERKDTNGNYSPENCEWIPLNEQAKNQRSNRKVTINGITKNVSDWSEISGVHRTTINSRISKGLTGEALLKKPKETRKETVLYEYQGAQRTLKEISEMNNCSKQALRKYLKLGLCIVESTEIVRRNKREKK